jgi:hypothetical protein
MLEEEDAMNRNTEMQAGTFCQSPEKGSREFSISGTGGGRVPSPWKRCSLAILCVLCGVAGALANGFTTYYVDAVNGNDANDGSSWDLAKQTIQNAVDNI